MNRLNSVNLQFAATNKPQRGPRQQKLKPIVDNVWESMGMDQHLSAKGIQVRKQTAKVINELMPRLLPYIESTEYPEWLLPELLKTGANGLRIKGYGSPGLSSIESGAFVVEMCKRDVSACTAFGVHNAIGMAVINALGDEEQKGRMLTAGMKFEKVYCFGLTEPENGSDATNIRTTAKKVEGGYILNGKKRWIGNGTIGDVIVWARNLDDGKRIQAFVVEKGSAGFFPKKMEGKMALRMTQNADIELKDCFVADNNKLTHAKDFVSGLGKCLEASRLDVGWMATGAAIGAYEECVRYCTKRKQFGRPIAQFQLVQERLSRMLANCEFALAHLARTAQLFDEGKTTPGQISRAKAHATLLARETVALARESMGGNGILLENNVINAMNDIEVLYTYEGTYDINSLISGRELTKLNALV